MLSEELVVGNCLGDSEFFCVCWEVGKIESFEELDVGFPP